MKVNIESDMFEDTHDSITSIEINGRKYTGTNVTSFSESLTRVEPFENGITEHEITISIHGFTRLNSGVLYNSIYDITIHGEDPDIGKATKIEDL